MDKRAFIAKNVAQLFKDGDVVNLGVGIPTLASGYVPEGMDVFFHAENGCIGAGANYGIPWDRSTRESTIAWLNEHSGERTDWRGMHKDLGNAGCEVVSLIPGACCFDTVTSFAIARGGHLTATVLGALQVDESCNLANWKIPGKKLNGMGGAMDIVSGARRVIIAMEHCNKNGEPKIVKKCTLPLTAEACVDTIITELCIIECKPGRLLVTAIAPGVTEKEIISNTAAALRFSKTLKTMAEL